VFARVFAVLLGATSCLSGFNLKPGIELLERDSVDHVMSLDFDHDGLRDIAFHDRAQDRIKILRQIFERSYSEEVVLVFPVEDGAIVHEGDFNGDGFGDLVIFESGRIRVLQSLPEGFEELAPFDVGQEQLDLKAVGDFDQGEA